MPTLWQCQVPYNKVCMNLFFFFWYRNSLPLRRWYLRLDAEAATPAPLQQRPRLRTPEKEPVSQREALGSKPYPWRIKEHTSLHWLLPASWHPEWSLHDGKSGPQIRTTFDLKVKCMLRWNEVTGGIWIAWRLLLFCSHSLISGYVAHRADCCHNR